MESSSLLKVRYSDETPTRSNSAAKESRALLQSHKEEILSSNQDLRKRLESLERRNHFHLSNYTSLNQTNDAADDDADDDADTIKPSRTSENLWPLNTDSPILSVTHSFDTDLAQTRVYQMARAAECDVSFRSSNIRSHAWSIISEISLANISLLSVLALPIYPFDFNHGAASNVCEDFDDSIATRNHDLDPHRIRDSILNALQNDRYAFVSFGNAEHIELGAAISTSSNDFFRKWQSESIHVSWTEVPRLKKDNEPTDLSFSRPRSKAGEKHKEEHEKAHCRSTSKGQTRGQNGNLAKQNRCYSFRQARGVLKRRSIEAEREKSASVKQFPFLPPSRLEPLKSRLRFERRLNRVINEFSARYRGDVSEVLSFNGHDAGCECWSCGLTRSLDGEVSELSSYHRHDAWVCSCWRCNLLKGLDAGLSEASTRCSHDAPMHSCWRCNLDSCVESAWLM